MPDNSINDAKKIDVLLKEYDSLRAEITARTTSIITFASILGAVVVGFSIASSTAQYYRQADSVFVFKFLAFLAIVAYLVLWLSLDRSIRRCANRLIWIEFEINKLAGCVLLEWETKWGLDTLGYFGTKPKGYKRPET